MCLRIFLGRLVQIYICESTFPACALVPDILHCPSEIVLQVHSLPNHAVVKHELLQRLQMKLAVAHIHPKEVTQPCQEESVNVLFYLQDPKPPSLHHQISHL